MLFSGCYDELSKSTFSAVFIDKFAILGLLVPLQFSEPGEMKSLTECISNPTNNQDHVNIGQNELIN
jgi:hypothetical protein